MSTILVVDDNPGNRSLLQDILERHQYHVLSAQHGAEALAIAQDTPPALIVSDILMPVMDGFALCRAWQQDPALKTIPFIFYTATYTTPEDRDFGLTLGAAHYLIKPLEPHELVDILRSVLIESVPDIPAQTEADYLKGYSDALVRKLESKIAQLEAVNAALEREIVERRFAERELQTLRSRYEVMFQNHIAVMLLIDPDTGIIVDANQAACQYYGYSYEALVALNIADINTLSPEQIHQEMQRARAEHRTHFEFCHRQASGAVRDVAVVSGPIQFDDKTLLYSIVTDITERKLAERQRQSFEREQERASVLEHFISHASHDLRTPLTTIKANIYLLKRSDDPARYQRYLDILEKQMGHLERLLEDMLNMSRLDRAIDFEFAPVDINTLIRHVVGRYGALAQKQQHTLVFIGNPSVPMVRADSIQLDRALANMVLNALHYTPEAGTITIRVCSRDQQVIIEIEDTGIGIADDDQLRIFDRFYRVDKARGTDKGGVGLGLSIAKRIIEAHQGRIEVKSQPGQGSTFRVLLPGEPSEQTWSS